MTERGKIRNKDFKRQIYDMSGLGTGTITPTDIDGFMDFGNRLFIFFESKHGNSQMPYGQKLALQRLTDACHSPPDRYSVLFLLSHSGDSEEICVADLPIVKYRYKLEWIDPKIQITLKQGIEIFRERYLK